MHNIYNSKIHSNFFEMMSDRHFGKGAATRTAGPHRRDGLK